MSNRKHLALHTFETLKTPHMTTENSQEISPQKNGESAMGTQLSSTSSIGTLLPSPSFNNGQLPSPALSQLSRYLHRPQSGTSEESSRGIQSSEPEWRVHTTDPL